MMLVPTYIAPSRIEGVGIFAAEDITAGTEIWRSDPCFDIVLTDEQIAALGPVQRNHVERYGYRHIANPGLMVLESDNGRFMNHSETPNTDFRDPERGIALCDIPAGAEMLCDYREFDVGLPILPGLNFVSDSGEMQQPDRARVMLAYANRGIDAEAA